MIVGLRRVRHKVDETYWHRVSDHVEVIRKLRSGCVHHAKVRPPWIDGAGPGLCIVRLNVLLELDSDGSQITNFEHHVLAQFALHGQVPLTGIAGSLVQVDAGSLNLSRTDYGRPGDIHVLELLRD